MTETNHREVIRKSKNSGELVVAAVYLARSDDPEDHKLLGQVLQTPEFLNKLDSEADYTQPRKFLRVASVITELEKNMAPSAQQLLIDLMQSPGFVEDPSRVELLIEASAKICPASPQVVAFWEKHSGAEDVYMNLLMHMLGENGSKPALELFEKKISDPVYPDKKRIWWMRTVIPPHRNQPAFLDSCLNLLKGGLADPLKTKLVEVLFHFQKDWFRPSTPITCAPLSSFDMNARIKLKAIGKYAIEQVRLDKTLRAAVNDTLEKLDQAAND